ncbi:hypothetical protein RE6C_01622 [Rhodopirellula europaea 6C]|uniref:Uncharacterized protein n=1 Tax=Rhodopirellula europaea 6C TaxID=1263867 RepID=M2AY75_9BACT|nr:hypothetical protein RE6C_01622 [Rhodopirellula europaea 6C]
MKNQSSAVVQSERCCPRFRSSVPTGGTSEVQLWRGNFPCSIDLGVLSA